MAAFVSALLLLGILSHPWTGDKERRWERWFMNEASERSRAAMRGLATDKRGHGLQKPRRNEIVKDAIRIGQERKVTG